MLNRSFAHSANDIESVLITIIIINERIVIGSVAIMMPHAAGRQVSTYAVFSGNRCNDEVYFFPSINHRFGQDLRAASHA